MKKDELRRIYLDKKKRLTSDQITTLSYKIFLNFKRNFELKKGQKVHCFLSVPDKGEVDTSPFLDCFFENDIGVFVPKIVKGKLISVEINRETQFQKNSWGIREPESNLDSGTIKYDYIITPLLYADKKGNRVGYGKGFYDRFFSTLDGSEARIGVGFFSPSEPVTDVNEFDIPLNYLITPDDAVSFGNGLNFTK